MILSIVLLSCAMMAAVIFYGKMRWRAGGRSLRRRLEAAQQPPTRKVFDPRELEPLPAPVQRYFRAVLATGQPIVAGVQLEQTGTFNMNETTRRWKPFTATQRVITCRPGFDWDARITMMPGVSARVHDAYVEGEGFLHAAVFGLVSVAKLRGTGELARGELMRYFAEAAWYPTALLPSQGICWEAVDDRSARATLRDGNFTITLLFHFNADGRIDTVNAESRGRTAGVKATSLPWQCRLWDYVPRDGMHVPLQGEAAWIHPDGVKPYWRGKITKLSYEFANRGSLDENVKQCGTIYTTVAPDTALSGVLRRKNAKT